MKERSQLNLTASANVQNKFPDDRFPRAVIAITVSGADAFNRLHDALYSNKRFDRVDGSPAGSEISPDGKRINVNVERQGPDTLIVFNKSDTSSFQRSTPGLRFEDRDTDVIIPQLRELTQQADIVLNNQAAVEQQIKTKVEKQNSPEFRASWEERLALAQADNKLSR